MTKLIESNPKIMGGTPVFKGTRVPIQTLFDYIEGEETIEEFLEDWADISIESIKKRYSTLILQREKDIKAFNINNKSVNPEQKTWILSQVEQGKLDGKTLLYMNKKIKGEFYYSHADALADIVNEREEEKDITQKDIDDIPGEFKPCK